MVFRRVVAVMLSVLAVFAVTACGGKEPDAKKLVHATLDAAFKGDVKEYSEMTKQDESEVEALYRSQIDGFRQQISSYGLDEAGTQFIVEYFEKAMSELKYEVGESVKKDDGSYEVKVTYEPLEFGVQAIKKFSDKTNQYMEDMMAEATNGELETVPSDEEINQKVMDMLVESFRESMDEGFEYGDPQETVIHVVKDGRYYTVDKNDVTALGEKIISVEQATLNMPQ